MNAQATGSRDLVADSNLEVTPPQRPRNKQTPGEWVKANLFSNVINSIITLVLLALVLYLVWSLAGWAIGAEWQVVRTNLRNFMIGGFPKEELWRIWGFGYLILAGCALGFGALARTNHEQALENELESTKEGTVSLLRRFAPLVLLSFFFVSFARTPLPYIGVAAGVIGFFVLREVGWQAPAFLRKRGLYIFAYLVLAAFGVIAGASSLLGIFAGMVTLALVATELTRSGNANRLAVAGIALVSAIVVWIAISLIPFDGHGWDDWGGLLVTVFATVVGITIGGPLGVLLAIGRKSKLPAIKAACVLFIEFVRGVPLISLLLFSSFILPLLFPVGTNTRGDLTRAMMLITGFSAAYFAEIVRGGLQSVPKGQTEAAQASGMSPGAIQRLIVLPQAIRNVIPAMVGQAIALFKDTSLLSIIGIAEFLQFGKISNGQPEFLGKGLQPITYTFIAIGYWAIAYTMSRESRRMETKLGVGVR